MLEKVRNMTLRDSKISTVKVLDGFDKYVNTRVDSEKKLQTENYVSNICKKWCIEKVH